jgi:hypothetical protein
LFLPIKAPHLSNFRKVHAANPWRVWLLMCFLMVQSVFAVMDHHPVLESPSQHFARHLSDIDQHGSHHHAENLDIETMDFAMMDFDFGSSQDVVDEEHGCDNHFHGIKLVALPFSTLAVEIIPTIHERSDLSTSVRSVFPPPRYRPPIV